MNIDILYDFPQVFSDSDYDEKGVGGTESSIILTARHLKLLGHDVQVYNAIPEEQVFHGVSWHPLRTFQRDTKRDLLLIMRTQSPLVKGAFAPRKAIVTLCRKNNGLGVWVQEHNINMIVTVSQYQTDVLYATELFGTERVHTSSAGVDFAAYVAHPQKVSGKCLYCSVPYRGLEQLLDIWPNVKQAIPWASLYITSSYLLWGFNEVENANRCDALYRRIESMRDLDVINLIRVTKRELVQHQLESELLLYPSTYDELCCISALECAAASCAIVTTKRAALVERVDHGRSGFLVEGNPCSKAYQHEFAQYAIQLLQNSQTRSRFGEHGRYLAAHYAHSTLVPAMLSAIVGH